MRRRVSRVASVFAGRLLAINFSVAINENCLIGQNPRRLFFEIQQVFQLVVGQPLGLEHRPNLVI